MIKKCIIAVLVAIIVGAFSARTKITGEEAAKRFAEVTTTPMPANVQMTEMIEWNFAKGAIFGVSAGFIVFLLLTVIQMRTSNKALQQLPRDPAGSLGG